jgi:hypothetical protein
MGIFSRRDNVVDLTEDYHYQRKKSKANMKDNLSDTSSTQTVSSSSTQESSLGGFFNFFGGSNSSSSQSSTGTSDNLSSGNNTYDNSGLNSSTESLDAEEKRRRLALRLKNMTDRIEDLSNQLYQLQQKMEVFEKKINLGRYEQ